MIFVNEHIEVVCTYEYSTVLLYILYIHTILIVDRYNRHEQLDKK